MIMTLYNWFKKFKLKGRIYKAFEIDIQRELSDEEPAVLEEGDVAVKQIEEDIAEETTCNEICPECGMPVTRPILSGGPMGVGQTYAQRMGPYTNTYEVVCPRCGLVLRIETKTIHR